MWPPTKAENIDVVLFGTIGVLQACEFCKSTLARLVLECIAFLLKYTMHFRKRDSGLMPKWKV